MVVVGEHAGSSKLQLGCEVLLVAYFAAPNLIDNQMVVMDINC